MSVAYRRRRQRALRHLQTFFIQSGYYGEIRLASKRSHSTLILLIASQTRPLQTNFWRSTIVRSDCIIAFRITRVRVVDFRITTLSNIITIVAPISIATISVTSTCTPSTKVCLDFYRCWTGRPFFTSPQSLTHALWSWCSRRWGLVSTILHTSIPRNNRRSSLPAFYDERILNPFVYSARTFVVKTVILYHRNAVFIVPANLLQPIWTLWSRLFIAISSVSLVCNFFSCLTICLDLRSCRPCTDCASSLFSSHWYCHAFHNGSACAW